MSREEVEESRRHTLIHLHIHSTGPFVSSAPDGWVVWSVQFAYTAPCLQNVFDFKFIRTLSLYTEHTEGCLHCTAFKLEYAEGGKINRSRTR